MKGAQNVDFELVELLGSGPQLTVIVIPTVCTELELLHQEIWNVRQEEFGSSEKVFTVLLNG